MNATRTICTLFSLLIAAHLSVTPVAAVFPSAAASPGTAAQVNCSDRIDHNVAGRVRLLTGEYFYAEGEFTCTLNNDRENPDARMGRVLAQRLGGGRLYNAYWDAVGLTETLGAQGYLDAIEPYSQIIDSYPNAYAYAARAMLGWSLLEDGSDAISPDAVVADLTRALNAGADNPVLYMLRGVTALRFGIGNPSAADADIAEAFARQPDDTEFHRLVGNVMRDTGDYARAEEHYTRSINVSSDNNAPAFKDRGDLYLLMGNLPAAVEDYQRYRGFMPSGTQQAIDITLDIANANLLLGANPATTADSFILYLSVARFQVTPSFPLTPDAPMTVTITQGQVFRIPFTLHAGQVVDFSASSVEPGVVDPLLVLLAPSNAGVSANDNISPDDHDSLISGYVVPSDGDYSLFVFHSPTSPDGSVMVSMRLQ